MGDPLKWTPPNLNWQAHRYGSISLCMIMRNEEKVLPRCLKSVEGLVNEIIIVDTGSVDDSCNTAKRLGARVLPRKWDDDFSAARNYGLGVASCAWILIMDPDEVISKKDHRRIKELTRQPLFVAFQLPTLNYTPTPKIMGFHPSPKDYPEAQRFAGYVPSVKTRFFKNGLGIVFRGCWHELVDHYIAEKKLPAAQANIPVHHRMDPPTLEGTKQKNKFYLRLGEKKVREEPDNDQAWWELAVAEHITGYHHRAIYSIRQSLRKGWTQPSRLFLLASSLRTINEDQEANFAFEKAICKLYPNLTHLDPFKKNWALLAERP